MNGRRRRGGARSVRRASALDAPTRSTPRDNRLMTKAELHQLVDRLPDSAVERAAVLLEEIADGRIDPDQAWYWTREW